MRDKAARLREERIEAPIGQLARIQRLARPTHGQRAPRRRVHGVRRASEARKAVCRRRAESVDRARPMQGRSEAVGVAPGSCLDAAAEERLRHLQ
jgi:hypothetical protein